jgi:hypothetical protein
LIELALRPSCHLLRSKIFAELSDDGATLRHLSERLWANVEMSQLLLQPAPTIGGQGLIRPPAETEAIDRDRADKHARLLEGSEYLQLS